MPNWPVKDEGLINDFVSQLKLASYGAAYRSLLRQFQKFVMRQSAKRLFSEAIFRAWLKEELKSSPASPGGALRPACEPVPRLVSGTRGHRSQPHNRTAAPV